MKGAWLIPVLVCSLASAAFAKDKNASHAPSFEPEVFDAQRRELERELKVGTRYSEIDDEDRVKVLADLDRMAAMLSKVDRIEQLESAEKVEVYNLQAEINTVLTGAAYWSREVCKRFIPVGTRFPKVICKTVADWDRIRENNQNFMRSGQRAVMPVAPGGSGGQ